MLELGNFNFRSFVLLTVKDYLELNESFRKYSIVRYQKCFRFCTLVIDITLSI